MNFLNYVLALSTIGFGSVLGGEMITSPPITNWGSWDLFQSCPEGTFVEGFQLLTHYYVGPWLDTTAVNGVKFFCGHPGDPETVNITSGLGDQGNWGRIYGCRGGYLNGFQLQVEKNGQLEDETAIGNARFFCTNDESWVFLEGDGEDIGQWGEVIRCPNEQVFCSIQTQIQISNGTNFDATGMNNLSVECCALPTTTSSSAT